MPRAPGVRGVFRRHHHQLSASGPAARGKPPAEPCEGPCGGGQEGAARGIIGVNSAAHQGRRGKENVTPATRYPDFEIRGPHRETYPLDAAECAAAGLPHSNGGLPESATLYIVDTSGWETPPRERFKIMVLPALDGITTRLLWEPVEVGDDGLAVGWNLVEVMRLPGFTVEEVVASASGRT